MVLKQILRILLFTSSIWFCVAISATAQQVQDKSALAKVLRNSRAIREIPGLSEVELTNTSAQQLLVQSPAPPNTPTPEVVQVTGVKANPTSKGVEIILQTSIGQQLQLVNRSSGNSFITDIPNAQLRLPLGEAFTFRSDKPIAGVTQITVINFDAKTIRVTVTGDAGVPQVELFDSPDEGLIFSVASTAPEAQQQQPQTTQQPQADKPESQTQPSQPSASDEPIELVVTGEQDGYRVPDASTATKTDTPVRDIPQSIQVVPRQLIEDRAATNVSEAIRTVSGVNAGKYQGVSEQFNIRGFSAGTIFRNGSAFTFNYNFLSTDNLERIEVLKGPSSVLFGQGNPGGIVNLVTKQPLSEPYYSLIFSAGSYGDYRPSFDISGPLNSEKTVLYRFIGSYERSESFRDFVNSEQYFLTPTVQWKISANTQLTIDFEFLDSSITNDQGLPAFGRGVAPIPRTRFLGETGGFGDRFGKINAERYGLNVRFDQQFNKDWTLRNAFFAKWLNLGRLAPLVFSNVDETTGGLNRIAYAAQGQYNTYFNNLDVVGNFKTGSINHKLLTGFEFGKEINDDLKFSVVQNSYPATNIFNPIISGQRFSLNTVPITNRRDENNTTLGFYLQDQIAFTDNLKLVLGGRYDNYQVDTFNKLTSLSDKRDYSAFSPRVGIIYQPDKVVSLYTSYVQGFERNYGLLVSGASPPATESRQYEVGVKLDFGKINSTLAAYDITRTNVATSDPNNLGFSIFTGEAKSRGIELDVSGEILPGWNITTAYAYNDAFVSKDTLLSEGTRLVNAPRNIASLWTTYQIQTGSLQGLGFGLGLYYVDQQAGDSRNSYFLPSYFRTDASLFYRRNNWKAQLNFQNLFDVEYYPLSGQSRNDIQPGVPFSVLGTVSVEF